MFESFSERLQALIGHADQQLLAGRLLGLEKESLRFDPDGVISQRDHPRALGSALTHPHITTDYGEALLELVTPAFVDAVDSLDFLADLHTFVYQRIGDEGLWATSMPCVLDGEDSVRIGEYGRSNAGQMKTVYRRGLGHRYGKTMQVIAGIHYNYSYPMAFWQKLAAVEGVAADQAFIDARYMALIRNLQRYGWLLLYLFGASPAVCKSFVGERETTLQALDVVTLYEPWGTSLRMGDIGYRNNKGEDATVRADYNTLADYVGSLREAINTEYPPYRGLGSEAGDWQQLNANLLQIENEYYSTTRPKQITRGLEKPSTALDRRGIAYVELRSLDINPFAPEGIDRETVLFVETFMLFCLLEDSPPIDDAERARIDANFLAVAHRGRDPDLQITCRAGNARPLSELATAIVDACDTVAGVLEREGEYAYGRSVDIQRRRARDPSQTLSGRVLADMAARDESFFEFAERQSRAHQLYHQARCIGVRREGDWEQEVAASLAQQAAVEAEPQQPFGDFIHDYLTGP